MSLLKLSKSFSFTTPGNIDRVLFQLTKNIVVGLLICIQTVVCSAQDNINIKMKNGLVSLNINNAHIKQVLQEFTRQSEIKLWISEDMEPKQLTLHLKNQKIENVLSKLLQDTSYALVFDDNKIVTGLYVLPTGKIQPAQVKLNPKNKINRQQVLNDALDSKSLPDNIKMAILNQFGTGNEVRQQAVKGQREQAIETLIKQLQLMAPDSSEITKQLRQKLNSEKQLQQQ